jgi:hypothetical protein
MEPLRDLCGVQAAGYALFERAAIVDEGWRCYGAHAGVRVAVGDESGMNATEWIEWRKWECLGCVVWLENGNYECTGVEYDGIASTGAER